MLNYQVLQISKQKYQTFAAFTFVTDYLCLEWTFASPTSWFGCFKSRSWISGQGSKTQGQTNHFQCNQANSRWFRHSRCRYYSQEGNPLLFYFISMTFRAYWVLSIWIRIWFARAMQESTHLSIHHIMRHCKTTVFTPDWLRVCWLQKKLPRSEALVCGNETLL